MPPGGNLVGRAARSLYGRWRRLSDGSRAALEPLAEDVKTRALDLRGEADGATATRELHAAGERLAHAMVEDAAADPEVTEVEVRELRAELAAELDRLAGAEIEASRGPGTAAEPGPAPPEARR